MSFWRFRKSSLGEHVHLANQILTEAGVSALNLRRHAATVSFDDTPTAEYMSVDTPLVEAGASAVIPIRARWYEALVDLPIGSIILSAAPRVTTTWVSTNSSASAASVLVRSANFEHGVTDDWLSVSVRTESADFVATDVNQDTVSPLSGNLSGQACYRAVEIGIRVEFTNEGQVEIPGAPSAGSLELIVIAAEPT